MGSRSEPGYVLQVSRVYTARVAAALGGTVAGDLERKGSVSSRYHTVVDARPPSGTGVMVSGHH